MYCKKCGAEIDDDAVICLKCGCSTGKAAKEEDGPSGGFAVLGFLIPILGLILYFVWKNEYPQRANSIGKGALIGVIVSVVLPIVLSIVGISCVGCIGAETYY